MAEEKEMSEQTRAIIARLKAEGDLSRNTGTNSLKEVIKRLQGVQEETKQANIDLYYGLQQVRLEIGRFSDVFQSISADTKRQTEMLRNSVNLQETIDSIFQEQKELLEQDIKQTQENREEDKREEKIARVEQAAEVAREIEKPEPEREMSDEKADKKSGGVFSLLKKFRFSLKNILLVAGGLFVGFNLIKGFINGLTDGGFDRFQEAVINGFKIFADYLTDPDVLKTLGTLALIATPLAILSKVIPIALAAIQSFAIFRLGKQVSSLLKAKNVQAATPGSRVATADDLGLPGGTATGTAVDVATTAAAAGGLGALLSKAKGVMTGPVAPSGFLKSMLSARGLMFGAAATTMLTIGDSIFEWFQGTQSDMNVDELADSPMTEFESAGEIGNRIAAGATMGMMFGPKGAIVGAVIGGVISVGMAIANKINDYFNDTDAVANETQEAIKLFTKNRAAGMDPNQNVAQFETSQKEKRERIETEIKGKMMEIERLEAEKADRISKARDAVAVGRITNEYDERIKEVADETALRVTQIENIDRLIDEVRATLPKTPEDELEELTAKFTAAFDVFKSNSAAPMVVTTNNTPVNNVTNNYSQGGSTQQVVMVAGGSGNGGQMPNYAS